MTEDNQNFENVRNAVRSIITSTRQNLVDRYNKDTRAIEHNTEIDDKEREKLFKNAEEVLEKANQQLSDLENSMAELNKIDKCLSKLDELRAAAELSGSKKVTELVEKYGKGLNARAFSVTNDQYNKLVSKGNVLETSVIFKDGLKKELHYTVPLKEESGIIEARKMQSSLNPQEYSEARAELIKRDVNQIQLERNPDEATKEKAEQSRLALITSKGIKIVNFSVDYKQYGMLSDSIQKIQDLEWAKKIFQAHPEFLYRNAAIDMIDKNLESEQREKDCLVSGMSK